jgi:hypothetical protein
VTAEELLAAAGSAGPITSFRYEAPSLADLFHEAVQLDPEPAQPAAADEVLAPEGVAHV